MLGILKNEAFNIREWVEHYAGQGAEKVFLIDNGSTDGSLERIADHVASGLVETISLPQPHKQIHHYWTAFQHFRIAERCEWMVIADLDEFWFCKDGGGLSDALAEYQDYDVIYANWSQFGTSGFVDHPDSLRRQLVWKKPQLGPHNCKKYLARTSVPTKSLDIRLHKIMGADSSRTISDNIRFQINHYQVQSRKFWTEVKMTRGDADRFHQDDMRRIEFLEAYDRECTEQDTLLAGMIR
ncbi:glycosyltransferase family 92 protein [Ruegeria sediminis]|uniref:glycosyltransferase family 92 protein n=1 Tax=Ruegeria sediminis TaxID=2583820 RepID=UPI001485D65D|nr:glycosyltransferase family 92 protein [Ruegeria sediminis]